MTQQPIPPQFQPMQPLSPAPPAKKRAGVRMVVLTLVLICAVAVILNESVFQIRNVAVIGNKEIAWETVVAAAGLEGRISFFSINEARMEAGVNSHRYLIYEGMEKQFPSGLTLYVRERTPKANVQVMGVTYLLDEEGMVLERLGNNQRREDLLNVTGLQAREIRVGSLIVPGAQAQLDIYTQLIQELDLQNYADQVSELNLSNPDSLYLVTIDGYTAHLGDGNQLRAKIGTLRGVVAKLREMGQKDGVIEVSVPAVATYTPVEL